MDTTYPQRRKQSAYGAHAKQRSIFRSTKMSTLDDEARSFTKVANMLMRCVLLVDDNRALRCAVSTILESTPDVAIVGVASSGLEALELASRLKPDLILMDLSMPGIDGLEVSRRLTREPNSPVIVIMSIHDHAEYRAAALAAGAKGFLPKAELYTKLTDLIDSLIPPVGDAEEIAD
jgi:CheY-like chemotaxis protein